MTSQDINNESLIQINVGGKLFTTRAMTLMISPYFNSFLSRWKQGDHNILFIDRDPEGFENVLGLLRDPNYPFNPKYYYELEYFQLTDKPLVSNIGEFHSIQNGSSNGGKENILRWNKLTMTNHKTYIITIPSRGFLDCPIINTNKFSTINVYKDRLLLDSISQNTVNIFNSIYYSHRSDDNPCIRLPIFHHNMKQYKKNHGYDSVFGPINLEFVFDESLNDEPLALFYEMAEYIGYKQSAITYYNIHIPVHAVSPPGNSIVWIKQSIYSIVSEIWIYISVPIINLIIYLDDVEIPCTHNILHELANGKGIFPAKNHYIIQNISNKKVINLNICINIPLVDYNVSVDAVISKICEYPKTIY